MTGIVAVTGAAGALGEGVVRGRDATAFARRHVLVVVERERADVADRAELLPLVAAADALAAENPTDEGTVGESSIASRRRSNAAGTDLIMRRIAELLPERQRGHYGDSPDAG